MFTVCTDAWSTQWIDNRLYIFGGTHKDTYMLAPIEVQYSVVNISSYLLQSCAAVNTLIFSAHTSYIELCNTASQLKVYS